MGNEDYVPLDPKNVDAKAILIPEQEGSREALDQMELEEYEFDIVWSEDKGLWVTTLMNGNYLINVRAKGYKEINEVVRINGAATTDYKYIMKDANKEVPKIIIETVCVNEGTKVKNVFLELWKENLQTPEEGLSNDNGQFVYDIKHIGIHYIHAKKVGYVPLLKKINFTKGFLESQEGNAYKIVVPLMKVLREQSN